MPKTPSILTARSGKEIVSCVEKQGGTVRDGKGSHVVVVAPSGRSVAVPIHGSHDLGKGIRHKIIKQLLGIGFSILVITSLYLFSHLY